LTGVGFGLAATGVDQSVAEDRIIGLPVSAPTEQGILPLAVLAQTGILGAVLLVVFLYVIVKPVMVRCEPPIVALFLTLLFVNFGELIFFALGSGGMQMWLLVAVCYESAMASAGVVKGVRVRPCGPASTVARGASTAWNL
jgi:hypothetical protein